MPSVTARGKLDFCAVNLVLDRMKSGIKRTWMAMTEDIGIMQLFAITFPEEICSRQEEDTLLFWSDGKLQF